MPPTRPIIYRIVLAFIALLAIVAGILLFRLTKGPAPGVSEAIPTNYSLIIRVNDLPGLAHKLSHDSGMVRQLNKMVLSEGSAGLLHHFDSLLLTDPESAEFLLNTETYVVFFPMDEQEGAVLLMGLANVPGSSAFVSMLKEQLTDRTAPVKGNKDIIGPVTLNGCTFFYTIKHGILLAGYDPGHVMQAAEGIRSKKAAGNDPLYLSLQNAAGKKVDANIFVNFPRCGGLFNSLFTTDFRQYADRLKKASLSEYDVILKNDGIVVNGYTVLPDSSGLILSSIGGLGPQEINCTSVMPAGTARFTWIGFDDFSAFYSGFKETTGISGSDEMEKNLSRWAGNEMAVAKTDHPGMNEQRYTYGIFGLLDEARPLEELSRLPGNPVFSRYKDNIILITDDIPGRLFPQLFDPVGASYCIQSGDFIIMGGSLEAIHYLIDRLEAGRTLSVREDYLSLAENISDDCNLFFYYDISSAEDRIAGKFLPEVQERWEKDDDPWNGIQVIAAQFHWLNGWYYTHIYIPFDTSGKTGTKYTWETTLSAPVTAGPFVYNEGSASDNTILAFDAGHRLYCMDQNGILQWQRDLDGPLTGNIQRSSKPAGDRRFYLATGRSLHCLKEDGLEADGFPVQLAAEAVAGLALFDYESNGTYRILVPCADRKVYCFDKDGRPVKGWNVPELKNRAASPPQHIVVGKKDHVLFTDEDGNILIADRRGNERISLKQPLKKALNAEFHLNRTNSKGPFITTDSRGHLVYIDQNGRLQETVFGEFSPQHFFLYDDIDGNGHNDFIFLDGKKLRVYDRFKKPLVSFDLPEEVTIPPRICRINSKKFIGIATGGGEIYLFNGKGERIETPGVECESPITLMVLHGSNAPGILCGKGNRIHLTGPF